jgi:hypothetical protein
MIREYEIWKQGFNYILIMAWKQSVNCKGNGVDTGVYLYRYREEFL